MLLFLVQFESQFDPYIQYCMEEANCLKYFKEKLIESEEFRMYITVSSWNNFFVLFLYRSTAVISLY